MDQYSPKASSNSLFKGNRCSVYDRKSRGRISTCQGDDRGRRARIFRVGNRLVDACKAGNVKKAKQVIDACKSELLLQWSVCKAFLAACEGSHVNITRLLMANGLNPKIQPGVAHALHVSVTHNAKVEAVEFLVKAGFDVNQPRRPQMYTPLHIACMTKNAVMIEALIKLGADVNAVANDGSDSMPLNLCRKMGNNSKCIEILKKAGAKSTWRKQSSVQLTQSAKNMSQLVVWLVGMKCLCKPNIYIYIYKLFCYLSYFSSFFEKFMN